MKMVVFIVLILVGPELLSQDISGLWKGSICWKGLERDTITAYFDIRKGTQPNEFTGVSACINDKPGTTYWYGRAHFTCSYNRTTRTYLLKEDTLLERSSRIVTCDQYQFVFIKAKKILTGKVLCDPKGPNGFLCADTRIIELRRTNDPPPAMRKGEVW